MTKIISTNPSNNSILWTIISTSNEEIHKSVQEAKRSQELWSNRSIDERIIYLKELYDDFTQKKEIIAQSISAEMGMPIRQARDEVQYGLTYYAWYLENAEQYITPEITRENNQEIHMVEYEARWVVAAIAPWNYPFSMFVWTCIQALLVGNVVVFKISKDVILTGKIIADIISESSLPKAVWTEIYGDGTIGWILLEEDIDFVTFTGSTQVWKNIAKTAVEKGIWCVMELGGSAPWIICSDSNIDSVIETIYFLRYSNCGQMCDGLKRLIVQKERYNEVVSKLGDIIITKRIWNALDEKTDIWPLVSEKQQTYLSEQYNDALEKWAKVLSQIDEKLIPKEGNFFPPTLLGNITKDMRVWNEEVFWPILPIITFDNIEEAIELANDTEYWLGAYVFTENIETFKSISKRLKSGMIQMNTLNYCIPENPFWGYKNSWIGREHGKWGFHEFCNIKVTSIPKISQ